MANDNQVEIDHIAHLRERLVKAHELIEEMTAENLADQAEHDRLWDSLKEAREGALDTSRRLTDALALLEEFICLASGWPSGPLKDRARRFVSEQPTPPPATSHEKLAFAFRNVRISLGDIQEKLIQHDLHVVTGVDLAALRALTAARIQESSADTVVFEGQDSEDRVCRAELFRRRYWRG